MPAAPALAEPVRPILPLWAAVVASAAGGLVADDGVPRARMVARGLRGRPARARRSRGPPQLVCAARRLRVRRRLLLRQPVVHGALPRPRAVDRPVDARGGADGGLRHPDRPRVSLGAARAARRAGGACSCSRRSWRACGRFAKRSSGPSRTAATLGQARGHAVQRVRSPSAASWVGHRGTVVPPRLRLRGGRSSTSASAASATGGRRVPTVVAALAPGRDAAVPDDGCRQHPGRRGAGKRARRLFRRARPERHPPRAARRHQAASSTRTWTCCCGPRAASTRIRRTERGDGGGARLPRRAHRRTRCS